MEKIHFDLIGVPASHLTPEIWLRAAELIKPALWEGMENIDDILEGITNRDLQLWLVVGEYLRGALVTAISVGKRSKVVKIRLYGGEMNGEVLRAIIDGLRPWAKAQGCDKFEIIGRKGWERFTKTLLATRSYVVLQGDV